MASVNHQHWHLYYLDRTLAIEVLPIKQYLLQGWPIPAIVFELSSPSLSSSDHEDQDNLLRSDITKMVKQAMAIIYFCLDSGQIAHNLFLTRTPSGSIRLFIWLLEPRFGLKDNLNINCAFCELSGYFIAKTQQLYQQLDELECVRVLLDVISRHEEVLHLLPS